MTGEEIRLAQAWVVGDRIAGGGFGSVFEVTSPAGERAAAKCVPKAPGAERELLFVDLHDVRNVVPILDSGEHGDYWVLVMPRADRSLKDLLDEIEQGLTVADAALVLGDVLDALIDLDGRVVHRDLKPGNVLYLNGHWCLADFGISRYAEATTAPDTQKYALTVEYAAPERWRQQRATIAADMYSLGVMAYEMLEGIRPFAGSADDLREKHLHAEPPSLVNVPDALGALVDECLLKAPEARPLPANARARLDRLPQAAQSGGLANLEQANRAEIQRVARASEEASRAQTESERHEVLAQSGRRSLQRISDSLRQAIQDAASSIQGSPESSRTMGWTLRLGQAELSLQRGLRPNANYSYTWGGREAPAFGVFETAVLRLKSSGSYAGRAHSLWYCDARTEGEFGWYETAFMFSPLVARSSSLVPMALDLRPGSG